jgi:hypothetical protein
MTSEWFPGDVARVEVKFRDLKVDQVGGEDEEERGDSRVMTSHSTKSD